MISFLALDRYCGTAQSSTMAIANQWPTFLFFFILNVTWADESVQILCCPVAFHIHSLYLPEFMPTLFMYVWYAYMICVYTPKYKQWMLVEREIDGYEKASSNYVIKFECCLYIPISHIFIHTSVRIKHSTVSTHVRWLYLRCLLCNKPFEWFYMHGTTQKRLVWLDLGKNIFICNNYYNGWW